MCVFEQVANMPKTFRCRASFMMTEATTFAYSLESRPFKGSARLAKKKEKPSAWPAKKIKVGLGCGIGPSGERQYRELYKRVEVALKKANVLGESLSSTAAKAGGKGDSKKSSLSMSRILSGVGHCGNWRSRSTTMLNGKSRKGSTASKLL